MAVFTQADFLSGKCKHIEIGTEAEPRWSLEDLQTGACTAEAVGTKRNVLPTSAENLNVNEVVQQALNQIGAAQLSNYLAGRPDIIAPLVVKLGLNSITKEQDKPVSIHELTDEDISSMSSLELKKLMLEARGLADPEGFEPCCPHCHKSLL